MRIIATIGLIFSMSITASSQYVYLGADLSYVNQMEDCGGLYSPGDPYELFEDRGANLVRIRLWHTPSWYDDLNEGNRYSDLNDVIESLTRSRDAGMQTLLDFHLSDTWADPGHQVVPAAWAPVVGQATVLGDSLYNYIQSTLLTLHQLDILPAIVQIGNETNKGILQSQQDNDSGWKLEWIRNAYLFNRAFDAVKSIEQLTGEEIIIAIHVANPTDALWLVDQFLDNGVNDFEMIGLSYYYQYHNLTFAQVGNTIATLKEMAPGRDVVIFETAYPHTTQNIDAANNLLSTVYPGYTFSPENQKKWMVDLVETVVEHGGSGVIYWEPAWISTDCFTQWGHGSHWDNADFFGTDDSLIENGGIGFYSHPYSYVSNEEIPYPLSLNVSYYNGQIYLPDFEIGNSTSFQLFDASGKILNAGRLISSQIDQILPQGFYVLQLTTEEGISYVSKFVAN